MFSPNFPGIAKGTLCKRRRLPSLTNKSFMTPFSFVFGLTENDEWVRKFAGRERKAGKLTD